MLRNEMMPKGGGSWQRRQPHEDLRNIDLEGVKWKISMCVI